MKAEGPRPDAERREARRYAIERDMLWTERQGGKATSPGHTVNMSRAGVLFRSDHPIPVGKTIEVTVSWPTATNSEAPLRLIARGRVVRVSGELAAVQFRQRQFHAR